MSSHPRVSLFCLIAFVLGSPVALHAQAPVTYTAEVERQLSRFGGAVSSVGDITGDGIDDAVIGAHDAYDFDRELGTGRVFVVNGETAAIIHAPLTPNPESSGGFGETVLGTADLNSDNVNDFLVGAAYESPDGIFRAGYVYAFSGANANLLWSAKSPNLAEFGNFGLSLAKLGDVNGDGREDFAVGAPGEPNTDMTEDVGRVYLVSGIDGTVFRTIETPAPRANGNFGSAVARYGDRNADGKDDILIGAQGQKPDNSSYVAGAAFLVSSADGSIIESYEASDPENNALFGGSIAAVPDTNNDGFEEILVGAYQGYFGDISIAGAAYVFSSVNGNQLGKLSSPNATEDGQFGFRVLGIPDVSGDGRGDFVVAAPGETTVLPHKSGRVHFFSGANGSLLTSMISPSQLTSGRFGSSMAYYENADGLGTPAMLIGAEHEGYPDHYQGGRAYRLVPDFSAPTVTITGPPGAAVNYSPVAFTVEFSEEVIGFEMEDIEVTGGTVGAVAVVDSTFYDFSIIPDAEGNVTVSIGADIAQSLGGTPNLPAAAVAFEYDITPPELLIRLPKPQVTTTGPAAFEVLYTGANEVRLTPAMCTILQDNGGNVDATITIEPINLIRYNVVLSNITGNGQVNIALDEGSAVDHAGNPTPYFEGNLSLIVEGNSEAEESDSHAADQDTDNVISLSELLRVIQFYNSTGLSCADPPASTEDGYQPGPGDTTCAPHSSDYAAQDWTINLSELLRLIQFFNTGGYVWCPDEVPATEDSYCPSAPGS